MPPTRTPSFFARSTRTILTFQHAISRTPTSSQHFQNAVLFSTTPKLLKRDAGRSPLVQELEKKRLADTHRSGKNEQLGKEGKYAFTKEEDKQIRELMAQGLSREESEEIVEKLAPKKGFWARNWEWMSFSVLVNMIFWD